MLVLIHLINFEARQQSVVVCIHTHHLPKLLIVQRALVVAALLCLVQGEVPLHAGGAKGDGTQSGHVADLMA